MTLATVRLPPASVTFFVISMVPGPATWKPLAAVTVALRVSVSAEALAVAEAAVVMAPETLKLIADEAAPKGDVVGAARLAGIMAAKRTHELIPLCHPLALSFAGVEIVPDPTLPGLRITAEMRLTARTGVEMEAMVAASVAALTVYDMCKAADRGMVMSEIRVLEKHGGKSGSWVAAE